VCACGCVCVCVCVWVCVYEMGFVECAVLGLGFTGWELGFRGLSALGFRRRTQCAVP